MRRFVIGDIHGNFKALKQVLKKSKIDYKKDKLIVLGDTVDGLPQVKQCFNELLKIKNLIYILGNHDEWALDWYEDAYRNEYSTPETLWTSQGGWATLESYGHNRYDPVFKKSEDMPKRHKKLLIDSKLYHVEDDMVFTHGGILETAYLESTDKDVFLWDRGMFEKACMVHPVNPDFKFHEWDKIFIGHTTIQYANRDLYFHKHNKWIKGEDDEACLPLHVCNVWNLDTGAGWSGKLTIMNIDTEEYWQSDNVKTLYLEVKGR